MKSDWIINVKSSYCNHMLSKQTLECNNNFFGEPRDPKHASKRMKYPDRDQYLFIQITFASNALERIDHIFVHN